MALFGNGGLPPVKPREDSAALGRGRKERGSRIESPEAAPQTDRRKSHPAKEHQPATAHKRTPFDPNLRHDTCQTDPDLAAVVDAWDALPKAVRAGIVAMVRASTDRSDPSTRGR
jgi:hypothetical protein